MTEPTAVYVASPLGFTVPAGDYYRHELLPALAARGLLVLDPWDAPFDDLAVAAALPPGPEREAALAAANRRHGDHNRALLDRSAMVFAVLDGSDVDSGTAAEIGYASARGIPIVGWRSDLRLSGDNTATPVNLQVAAFVEQTGGAIHRDRTAALSHLARIAGRQ